MFVYGHRHVTAHTSEGNLLALVLSLQHMSPKDQTWVIRKHVIYPLRHVNGPECSFLSKNDLLNLNVSFNISTIAENVLRFWQEIPEPWVGGGVGIQEIPPGIERSWYCPSVATDLKATSPPEIADRGTSV